MRAMSLALAFAVIVVSALAVTGCGDSQPTVTKEALTKPTDTTQFNGMMEQMKANVPSKKH